MRPRMQLIVQRNVNFNFASKLVRTPIAVMAQLVLSQAGVLCLRACDRHHAAARSMKVA